MDEVTEEPKAGQPKKSGKKGKSGTRSGKKGKSVTGTIDVGPLGPHTVMLPRQVWKDLLKKAVDEDTSASALIVEWVVNRMRRFGFDYMYDDQADAANSSVEILSMSETLTSSHEESSAPPAGEGEGGEELAPTPRARKRA